MSDDPLDRSLGHMARAARSEVERGIDGSSVEAALDQSIGDDGSNVRLTPHPARGSSVPTWMMIAAAASVVALVVAAAYVLVGRDDQISSETPPTSEPTDPVATAPLGTSLTAPIETTVSTTTNTSTPVSTIDATTTTVLLGDIDVITSLDGLLLERYLPDAECLEDDCAQIAYDAGGSAWTFRNGVLTNHARGGAVVPLPEPWSSVDSRDIGLIAIGPDDVAYFSVYQASESAALVGVSVADGNVGEAVVVVEDAIDVSGDIDYVPTPAGLAKVGCCGSDQIRPAPDAEMLVEWLDRAGDIPPVPSVTFDAGTVEITRGDVMWAFAVAPQRLMARGMPHVTPTHDGGVVGVLTGLDAGLDTGTDGTGNYIVRGWPDGSTSVAALSFDLFVSAVSPEGFVALVSDGQFVVADLFSDHPPPDDVTTTIDVASGTVTLDSGWPAGLDEVDQRLAGANAIAGPVRLGERRMVDALDAGASVVVVTTEGFLDDSVFGQRLTIDFTNETIGWAQACQPDRGHQDYQAALCV